jgi:hypothetical protein
MIGARLTSLPAPAYNRANIARKSRFNDRELKVMVIRTQKRLHL